MTRFLHRHLNSLFEPTKKLRRKPGIHVVCGIQITKHRGLWEANLPSGDLISNSHLGDLKDQLRRLLAEEGHP